MKLCLSGYIAHIMELFSFLKTLNMKMYKIITLQNKIFPYCRMQFNKLLCQRRDIQKEKNDRKKL